MASKAKKAEAVAEAPVLADPPEGPKEDAALVAMQMVLENIGRKTGMENLGSVFSSFVSVLEAIKIVLETAKSRNPEITEMYLEDLPRYIQDDAFHQALSEAYQNNAVMQSFPMDQQALSIFESFFSDFAPHTRVGEAEVLLQNLSSIPTRYPKNYITPVDKASRELFSGTLEAAKTYSLAMERKGAKKEITTLLSINFDDLGQDVEIQGRKELTAYDREVHDAIVTLYVDGGNKFITPQMIYQTMTGDKAARLPQKQAAAIRDSVAKCMYSRVSINADEEGQLYGFSTFRYDGYLVPAERVTATLNGETVECLHLLRTPVLYEYADKKNQIGRVDMRMLNTPINKTEEILTLQGYLQRRILSMKGSGLSKAIVYDTVYKYLRLFEGTEAFTAAEMQKKKRVRANIKSILDYWKQEGFIRNYTENKRGNASYSVSIRL